MSNFLATGIAIVLNYILSVRYIFESGKYSKRREFTYFVLLSIATLILSWRVFAFVSNQVIPEDIEVMGMTFSHLVINKIIAIGITSLLNYALKKRIVFNG